ncbi:MAG TPA: adenylyl-sulfate kinase [Segetibacter sp.]|nr:adenylyl-sulfate kinase [Segetibacter sp.]
MTKTIFPFDSQISYEQRKEAMMQEPRLIWLTGLSGSGKSTLALRLEHYFFFKRYKVFILDGDNVRNGLCRDLGFSEGDRKENLRRVGEVSKLMLDAGLTVICAFISPCTEDRKAIKDIVGEGRFIEVYVHCSVEVCEKRDVKGLYAKARQGIIPNFTGVSAPYDPPVLPDVEVHTAEESIEESMFKIIKLVEPAISLQTLQAYYCI